MSNAGMWKPNIGWDMAVTIDYLKDAKRFEIIAAVFAWIASALYLTTAIWLIGALAGDWSWWATCGFAVGGRFCHAQWRAYHQEAQNCLQKGIATGDLVIDENNVAQPSSARHRAIAAELGFRGRDSG